MSTNLSWELPPAETKKHYIGLKYEIGNYFEEDYNGGTGSWKADRGLIPFLKGIAACGNEGNRKNALELIEAIEKYGEVILTIS